MRLYIWNEAVYMKWGCIYEMRLYIWNEAVYIKWGCIYEMRLYIRVRLKAPVGKGVGYLIVSHFTFWKNVQLGKIGGGTAAQPNSQPILTPNQTDQLPTPLLNKSWIHHWTYSQGCYEATTPRGRGRGRGHNPRGRGRGRGHNPRGRGRGRGHNPRGRGRGRGRGQDPSIEILIIITVSN